MFSCTAKKVPKNTHKKPLWPQNAASSLDLWTPSYNALKVLASNNNLLKPHLAIKFSRKPLDCTLTVSHVSHDKFKTVHQFLAENTISKQGS